MVRPRGLTPVGVDENEWGIISQGDAQVNGMAMIDVLRDVAVHVALSWADPI